MPGVAQVAEQEKIVLISPDNTEGVEQEKSLDYFFSTFHPQRAEMKAGQRNKPKIFSLGNLFAFKPNNLFEEPKTIQGKKSLSVIIDRASAWDIDDQFDFKVAQSFTS